MDATQRVVELPDLAATEALAGGLASLVRAGDAVLLAGPLGAGKTAFARAFLRALSGNPGLEVPSPSFTLVQTYATRAGPVHHFDLWRLEGPGRLTELGWEEALSDIVLVEWPERLGVHQPPNVIQIELDFARDEARRARLTSWPSP